MCNYCQVEVIHPDTKFCKWKVFSIEINVMSFMTKAKKMFEVEGSQKKYPGVVMEEHYSVCMEPGGQYLFHFTPETECEPICTIQIVMD